MSKWFNYVRIAVAMLCGFTCVLLLALWLRSYWYSDDVEGPILRPHGFSLTSMSGRFMFGGGDEADPITEWDYGSSKIDDIVAPVGMMQSLGPVFAFHLSDESGGYIHVPHWFPALIAGSIAFAFAKRRRYSLRTLLIIATIISLGLGAIAYYSTHADQGGMGGGGGGGLAYDIHLPLTFDL